MENPDPFFVSAFNQFVADQFPNGATALDLAGGVGRHALWLAKRNWRVTIVDISEVAIHKLDQKALQLDLRLNLFALDATEYQFEPGHFDLIVPELRTVYRQERPVLDHATVRVAPGRKLRPSSRFPR